MEQRDRAAQQLPAAVGPGSPDVVDMSAVDPRPDVTVEVLGVLDDPGDDQRQPRALGDVDRLRRPLVGMDPSEEEQIAARPRRARMRSCRSRDGSSPHSRGERGGRRR
jgi:hypothetical protein